MKIYCKIFGSIKINSYLYNTKKIKVMAENSRTKAAPYEGYKTKKQHEDAIAKHAEKYYFTTGAVLSQIWKVKDRFYRYNLTDKDALNVLRRFHNTKGASSLDGYLKYSLPVDIFGAKRFYQLEQENKY